MITSSRLLIFHLPNTNIYIEVKYRQISSDLYKYTLFDEQKVNKWISSEKFSNSIIYLVFYFARNVRHFQIRKNQKMGEHDLLYTFDYML